MTRPSFGSADQLGFVVDDIEADAQHWHGVLGVGPFLVMRDVQIEGGYADSDRTLVPIHVAISYLGDVQIELIQPLDDAQSPYAAVRDRAPCLHHVARFTEEFDQDLADLRAVRTHARCFEGSASGIKLAYLEGRLPEHPAFELLDVSLTRDLFTGVHALCQEWDGTDLLRESI